MYIVIIIIMNVYKHACNLAITIQYTIYSYSYTELLYSCYKNVDDSFIAIAFDAANKWSQFHDLDKERKYNMRNCSYWSKHGHCISLFLTWSVN